MRVDTALGEYPFQFRRLERRGDGVAVVGLVAGLKSDLPRGRGVVLAAAALGYLRRASR